MKTIDLLRQLQTVDSALDADRVALSRVVSELADRSPVEDARIERDRRAATLRKVESDQRDLELEVDQRRGQLEAIEKKLYSGRVGDAKELNNLNREAGQMRRLISTREDRLLELFEAADQATAERNAAEARLSQLETERSVQEATLGAQRDRLREAIATGGTTREHLREQTSAAVLRTYDNLRRSRGGLAVAEIRQRTCQGCRISLPASEETRARHGDPLVFCQSCGRVLYATL